MTSSPAPWSTARSNIPWDDPGFSRRMLVEHLSQSHDAASRRFGSINAQVAWIHEILLSGEPSRVLDLGCGPGLYTERLARLGHVCHGIDIGPASIAHARETAERDGLACTYEVGDIRTASFGEGFDLVMLLYGEPSVFSPDTLRTICTRAASALEPDGVLLLEPHTEHGVAVIGEESPTEDDLGRGLFLDAPHRLRTEGRFDPATGVGTRHWVVEPGDGEPIEHWAWYQAYAADDLVGLLKGSGFRSASVEFHTNLVDTEDPARLHFVTAVRRAD
jgi:SAM-dependent methyltransferase